MGMRYSDPKARAEAKFKIRADQKARADQAMREYRAKQQAAIDRIARLRELRLARLIEPVSADGHVVHSAVRTKRKNSLSRLAGTSSVVNSSTSSANLSHAPIRRSRSAHREDRGA